MARIYISSTYTDLAEHREAVYRVLRRMGHDVIAIEDYAATDTRLLDKSLADVASSDLYIGILAWRYGYILPGENQSTVELEFREAVRQEIPRLLFLLDEDAPWPRTLFDEDLSRVEAFRKEL